MRRPFVCLRQATNQYRECNRAQQHLYKGVIGNDRSRWALGLASLSLMYTVDSRALVERTLTAWVALSLLFSVDA
jgi:hypothetical protein